MSIRLIRDDEEMPAVSHPSHVQFGERLIDVPLPDGLPTYDEILQELHGYVDVLKGHADSPVLSPYLSLLEVATAYLARAYEIEMLIYEGEISTAIQRGDPLYRLRTGLLASFINMARKLTDLGSRRLTQESLLSQQRRDVGESY